MRFSFIASKEVAFPVDSMCRVLGVSRSGYYAWRERPTATRKNDDERLSVDIVAAHQRGRRVYGSPRVHAELRAQGIRVGRKRVERLMREKGIVARRKRRFRHTTDSAHSLPVARNVLGRQFQTSAPNKVWVTDVTYVWTDEGWLYLAAILDLFSRRVVGWAASANNDTALALEALGRAVAGRGSLVGTLHHSDRGCPYASAAYTETLTRSGLVASMSRKGNCWDNSVAESFFGTLKGELIDYERYGICQRV